MVSQEGDANLNDSFHYILPSSRRVSVALLLLPSVLQDRVRRCHVHQQLGERRNLNSSDLLRSHSRFVSVLSVSVEYNHQIVYISVSCSLGCTVDGKYRV